MNNFFLVEIIHINATFAEPAPRGIAASRAAPETQQIGSGDEQGITLGDGLECLPAKLEILKSNVQSEALITIREGKFHQIKRMLASRGKPVVYLKRLSMGSLTLDEGLSKGEYRLLTVEEIKNLRESGQFAQGKAGADK